MIRCRVIITGVICFLTASLHANPISPYEFPVISEVQWIDSLHWSIEISLEMWVEDIQPGWSTDEVRLYIQSSYTMYSTQLKFNEEGLAVITPESITGIPEGEKVEIRNRDTIFIPDLNNGTSWIDDGGWICGLDFEPHQRGWSLIGMGRNEFIMSSRNSIGSAGNYTSRYNLQILNRDNLPQPGIFIYWVESKYVGLDHTYTRYIRTLGTSDENGIVTGIEKSIGDTTTCHLADRTVTNQNFYTAWYPEWEVGYSDSIEETTDTIVFAPCYHLVTVTNNSGENQESLIPVAYYSPSVKWGSPQGESIGDGTFLFTIFSHRSNMPISFLDISDSLPVAACTCSYVATSDTIKHTLVSEKIPVSSNGKTNLPCSGYSGVNFTVITQPNIMFIVANRYSVTDVKVAVYTIEGRKVISVDLPPLQTGTHSLRWNGTDSSGKRVAAGRYMCRLLVNGTPVAFRKISLL